MIFLLLLLLPSQLAFHFWPSWSLINGIRVDYLSPTLYLTDLIIIGLFLTSRLRVRVPLLAILFVVLNILISYSPLVSLYKWLRVLEYFWLFKYLTLKIDFKFKISNLKFAVLWTSALAWWQFFLQHSVGGFWYWLGERPLSVSTPFIAKISFFGYLLMRPYSTFAHPNALAGFLLAAGLILYSLNRKITPAIVIAFLTIPLTFSRTAIILEVIVLLFWLRPLLLKILLLISGFYFLISITGSAVSIPDRLDLINKSLFLIQKSPVLGVGLGNFLPATGLYQPVHNIFLLLMAELGLPITIIIFIWVIKNFLKSPVILVLLTGMFDHYWLTLHQNTLLLVILIAYAYSYRWGSQR